MNAQLSPTSLAALTIGAKLEIGYLAGYVTRADGVYAVEVAPKSSEFEGVWLPDYTAVPGATSCFDGQANTRALAEAGSQTAKRALETIIDGTSGWYIPARDELELLYRAFKPTDEANYVSRSGDNPSSVPVGYPYTEESPVKTAVALFQEGGDEAFEQAWYWSSTQSSRNGAWAQVFVDGLQFGCGEGGELRVRLVRSFKV